MRQFRLKSSVTHTNTQRLSHSCRAWQALLNKGTSPYRERTRRDLARVFGRSAFAVFPRYPTPCLAGVSLRSEEQQRSSSSSKRVEQGRAKGTIFIRIPTWSHDPRLSNEHTGWCQSPPLLTVNQPPLSVSASLSPVRLSSGDRCLRGNKINLTLSRGLFAIYGLKKKSNSLITNSVHIIMKSN